METEVGNDDPSNVQESAGLQDGHFLDEFSFQTSFFEKARGGVVDHGSINSMLGDPYPVQLGQQYSLCDRHILCIEYIVEPPHSWAKLLTEKKVFVPWPDVLAADIFHYGASQAVLVQSDCYIAGLILLYYIEKYGEASVRKIS